MLKIYDYNGNLIDRGSNLDNILEFERLRRDDAYRIVARTELPGDVIVSTVWLGIDHRYSGHAPPLIFETMIFGGAHDRELQRWCTIAEAQQGHAEMVAELSREAADHAH